MIHFLGTTRRDREFARSASWCVRRAASGQRSADRARACSFASGTWAALLLALPVLGLACHPLPASPVTATPAAGRGIEPAPTAATADAPPGAGSVVAPPGSAAAVAPVEARGARAPHDASSPGRPDTGFPGHPDTDSSGRLDAAMRPATPEGPAVQSLAAPLKPLAGDQWLVDLPVEAHRPAVVGLPLGTTSPRPVLVVTHGALGLTRPYCEMWRGIVGDRAFVLCPRGARMSPYLPDDVSGHFYPSHLYLADEVTAALAALHARYGERVDLRAPVYAGFSQGANMGALVLPDHPARFARAALVEGGVGEYLEWNVAVAARWHEAGATRVLFACGRHDCAEAARQSRHALRLGGLESALVYVGGAGHHWDGPMQRALEDSFAWLVEGDARFAAPTMHASDDPDPLTAAMGPRLGSLMASRSLEADGAPAPTAIEATPER